MVLLLGGMVLYLHLVACLIWQVLHVLSSARGVFGGIELLQKNRRVCAESWPCDYLSKNFFLTPPPPVYEVAAFHLLSCICSPVWSFYMVLLKCVEMKQQRLICRVCAFYPVCGSGSACFLIMQYRANSSSSCLLVVHIEVLDVVLYAPVFCSSILKGIISSCVVMVLLKCVELKYIAFNSALYRCRYFVYLLHYNALESK